MRVVRTLAVVCAGLLGACGFKSPGAGQPGIDAGGDAIDSRIDGTPTAWLHPWSRRKAITLTGPQIKAPGGGALTDFPVLISVTDQDIASSALPTGADIVFTADDAKTVLASEIESFSQTSKELVAWVKVPSLPAGTDAKLYVYYGYTGISSPPAQTPEDVWTANYLGVWHLQQDPGPGGAGDIKDAASGNHDGTASTSLSANDSMQAKIGRGIRLDGMSDFLAFPTVDVGNAFTISMWVFFTGGTNVKTLLANSVLGGDTDGFRFFINTANIADRKIIFETGSGGNKSARQATTDVNAIPLSTYTHVAVVVDRTADAATIFLNGANAAATTSLANQFATSSDFDVGQMEDGVLHFPGFLDEVEVATVARPPEWLETSFNNQSQPNSFHKLGPQEMEP